MPHVKVDAQEAAVLYKGHETAAHGQYHECLTGMDTARCVEEILESRKELEILNKNTVTGYAYAFGAYDESGDKGCRSFGNYICTDD